MRRDGFRCKHVMDSIPFTRSKFLAGSGLERNERCRNRKPAVHWGVVRYGLRMCQRGDSKLPIFGQHVVEELMAEKLDGPIKQRTMTPGEFEPPVPFSGKHARYLEYKSCEFGHLLIPVRGEGLKASNIPGRDNGLIEKPVQLVAPFDAILLFLRQPLALLADVKAMAPPAELLVRTYPTADSAIMAHWRILRVLDRCQGLALSKLGFAAFSASGLRPLPSDLLLLQQQEDAPGFQTVTIHGNLVHRSCGSEETDLAGHARTVIVVVGHQ